MSDKFADAVCRVAAEFGLPLHDFLSRELRSAFASRLAAAVCLEVLVNKPVCCLPRDGLYPVFQAVLKEFGFNERDLFAQEMRLAFLRRVVLALAVECTGSVEAAAKQFGVHKRALKSAHAFFERDAEGSHEQALHLKRLRALARGQRSTEENQSDAVKGVPTTYG